MHELVFAKLDDLIKYLDNSEKLRRLSFLKKEIESDSTINKAIFEYKKMDNKYDSKTIELKRNIINNPFVREYKDLENELYFLVLEINKKLSSLTGEKSCGL